jgi:hypothetical protein
MMNVIRQNLLQQIADERGRQETAEGCSAERDDQYVGGELAWAGAAYAVAGTDGRRCFAERALWPAEWDKACFKPSSPERNLVKDAALILAELERLARVRQSGRATC